MIKIKGKIDRLIDKNLLIQQEKLRKKIDPKLEPLGLCFLAFLIKLLVDGRLHFCLTYLLQGQVVGNWAIVGWDH